MNIAKRFSKTYLIIVFAFLYFGFLAAPDITWTNTGVDNGVFVFAAMKFPEQVLTHPSGYPLFNWINGLIAWNYETTQGISHVLALSVALTSAITAGVLYHISRSLIAPFIFIASGTVISQSVIVEVYALATLFAVLIYASRDSRYFPLVAALALGTHHIVGLVLLPVIIYRRKVRKLRKTDVLLLLGLLFYIPMFYGLKPEFVGWSDSTIRNYFGGQSFMVLGLSPEDGGLQRLREALPLFFGGLGITAFVFLGFIKSKFKSDTLLVSIALLPFIFYWTHLLPQAFTYSMPGFAFIGLLIAKHFNSIARTERVIIVVGIVILLFGNVAMFHPDNSSARDFVTQLERLPEDSVVWTNTRGWEQLTSWPEELSITVVAADKFLIENRLIPTHISIVTDADKYASTIIACSGWFDCYQWSKRDSRMEFDSLDESTFTLLVGSNLITYPSLDEND